MKTRGLDSQMGEALELRGGKCAPKTCDLMEKWGIFVSFLLKEELF